MSKEQALVDEWNRLTAALAQARGERTDWTDYVDQLTALDAQINAGDIRSLVPQPRVVRNALTWAAINGMEERLEYIRPRVAAALITLDEEERIP